MISKIERLIAFRYLRPKKKEGFLKVISVFSFTGIALGVAILIIVMSVMNGFRTELINKILGFNPHIIVKAYDKAINKEDINNLDVEKENILRTAFTFSGQGILINRKNTTGILVRYYLQNDIDNIEQNKWAGEQNWSQVSFAVNEGNHLFTWKFIKDQGVTEGDDAAWIDFIVFPPTFYNNILLKNRYVLI